MELGIIACSKCGIVMDKNITKTNVCKVTKDFGTLNINYNTCPCCKKTFNVNGDTNFIENFEDEELTKIVEGDSYYG